MNRRRSRSFILITGTTLCLLIAAAFVASAWWQATACVPGLGAVRVVSGGVHVHVNFPPASSIRRHEYGLSLWNRWMFKDIWLVHTNEVMYLTLIPLWPLLLAAAIPTLLVWRLVPKFPRGHCRRCGYNLKGNTSGVCPECGECIDR